MTDASSAAPTDPVDAMIDAALLHVPFDGWSEASFRAAARDADVNLTVARGLFPRGAVDLALAFHRRGDRMMAERYAAADTDGMRYRDKVALAVRFRIEAAEDREAVRRGTTLFALPMHAADGARALWGTADAIWTALGDSSRDVNWYTKRATLSGVYSSTVLYWLGDDSIENQATWDFLDRRIDDVMRIEKVKAQVGKLPGAATVGRMSDALFSRIRAPEPRDDLPGQGGL